MRDLIISFAIGMWSLWTEVLHEIRSNWRGGSIREAWWESLWKVDRWRGLIGQQSVAAGSQVKRITQQGEILGGSQEDNTTPIRQDRTRDRDHIHPDSGQCVINIGQVASKYWFMENMLYGVGRGHNGAICSKKVPNSWSFQPVVPLGVWRLFPPVSPGWRLLSNSIPPLWSAPSPTQINRGKRQKV